MLQCALKQTSFFTELTNGDTIIVLQNVVSQDSVGHVRICDQIHFKQTGLQV